MSMCLLNIVFRSFGGGQESRSDRASSKVVSANYVLETGSDCALQLSVSFNCARYRDRIVDWQTVQ